jgi:hypothetical protein
MDDALKHCAELKAVFRCHGGRLKNGGRGPAR